MPQSGNCYLCTQFILHHKLPTGRLRWLLLGYSISVRTETQRWGLWDVWVQPMPVHLGCVRLHKVHFPFLSPGCLTFSLFSRDCEIASLSFKIFNILSCFRTNLEKNAQTTCTTRTEHFSFRVSIAMSGLCIFLFFETLTHILSLFLVSI